MMTMTMIFLLLHHHHQHHQHYQHYQHHQHQYKKLVQKEGEQIRPHPNMVQNTNAMNAGKDTAVHVHLQATEVVTPKTNNCKRASASKQWPMNLESPLLVNFKRPQTNLKYQEEEEEKKEGQRR